MSAARVASHRWFVTGELRLHGLSFDEGTPTVVCLHGVGGHAWSWLAFVEALADGERPLALDLRGHGDSQWSPEGDYATTSHARDVEAVLETVGASGVTIVGSSWGGLVGIVLAARRPDLVARVVAIDLGPASTKSPEDVPARPSSFASHDEVVAFERGRNPRLDAPTADRLAFHGTRPGPDGRLVPKHDPVFARRWGFRSEDHWDALHALEVPLLVVRATDSPVLPDEDAQRMVAEARLGRLERVADTGHLVHVDAPAWLATTVRAFAAG